VLCGRWRTGWRAPRVAVGAPGHCDDPARSAHRLRARLSWRHHPPAILDILDDIDLATRLLETVPHTEVQRVVPPFSGAVPITVDFAALGGRFPFMTLMAQAQLSQLRHLVSQSCHLL
jgi:hypothetical protein